jgi:hypothetical protein
MAMSVRKLTNTAMISGTKSSKSLIDELLKNSAALQFTNESWIHLQPTYEIYSFYETLASPFGLKNALVKAFLFFCY